MGNVGDLAEINFMETLIIQGKIDEDEYVNRHTPVINM